MQETTLDDRRQELEALLEQMRAHPERDWTRERERARVLSEMIEQAEAARC